MRYITAEKLKEGMILAKPFYGNLGVLLLNAGVQLTSSLIQKVRELKYSGLYINDEFSDGVEVNDIVAADLRSDAANEIQRLMQHAERGERRQSESALVALSKLMRNVIEDLGRIKEPIVNQIDLKIFDQYLYQHSVNVAVLSCLIGKDLELSQQELYNLTMAAVLHDVGKAFVRKELLNKQGRILPEEFEELKKHSSLGQVYVRDNFAMPNSVYMSILHHHEHFDGSGYPQGHSGDRIQFFARIIRIADTYDAISSRQPYHEPLSPSKSYGHILGNAGRHFDPEIVPSFARKIAPYPLGMNVRLSNGLEGLVFENYADCLTRPRIKLFPLPDRPTDKDIYLDLKNNPNAQSIMVQEIIM